MKNRLWIITVILILLIIGVLVPWLKARAHPSPNILLITIDSLRPDHLGCYGYKKNTSPNIDKLAREGILFTQAIAQGSWTATSVASFVTSTYPSTHNIYSWELALSPRLLTIAELLKRQGYRNFFCSGSDATLSAILGLQRGFDNWTYNEGFLAADKVNAQAVQFLEKNYQRKFFLWIHYMDAHEEFFQAQRNEKDPMNAFQKSANIYKYDAGIGQIDSKIGAIIDELKRLNIDKNTLIIITADHGEEICEHGKCFTHAASLWDSLIRVPLIMVWRNHFPGNHRESDQVQLIDIAPTICNILKIKQPVSFEGQSLLPIINGSQNTLRPAFSEQQNRKGEVASGDLLSAEFSVRLDNWKLIYIFYSPNETEYSLYNLKNDPGELNNLNKPSLMTEAQRVKFESLKKELETWWKRKGLKISPVVKSLNEETKERLKGLGYLQ